MEPLHSHFDFIAYRISLKSDKGFTLIELMVVFAIIIAITGVVFTSQSTFNKTLILANTAYDVALTLRSTETYGLGSRVTSTGINNAGYGLHFEKGNNTFILFADVGTVSSCHTPQSGYLTGPDAQPGDCIYEDSERVKDYTLNNNITVSDLYADGAPVSVLDVVFARPNPDPFIRAEGSTAPAYSSACIAITSPQGGTRSVRVTSSGQITTNAIPCSP